MQDRSVAGSGHRRDVAKIYFVVGLGFLLLTLSYYLFGFRPLAQRLAMEHTLEIEHFLVSGKGLLEATLKKHHSLALQSASRTAIRKRQAAYLRHELSLQELIRFSKPKLADALEAEPDSVGITRYGPGGERLYSVGLAVPEAVDAQCGFGTLRSVRQLDPLPIDGKPRLVYCSPIVDGTSGLVGFDVLIMEDDALQSIVDAGQSREERIMMLFVSDTGGKIIYYPRDPTGFPSRSSLRSHLETGASLPGFIIRTRGLEENRWNVHAVVNEKLFFADINRRLGVLTTAVAIILAATFILTVLVLRPIIRTLVREANLLEMSSRDGLTNLFNHRFMLEHLDREMARARRSGKSLSIILFDIDHFKRFNDLHGHQTGDDVLRKVAAVVVKAMRAGDIAARYGGEEFMLMLPGTSREGAAAFARRLLGLLEAASVPSAAGPLNVSVSAGVATLDPEDGEMDKTRLIRVADEAMYESKAAGRNRVTVGGHGSGAS